MNYIDKPYIVQSTLLVMTFVLVPHFLRLPIGITLLILGFLGFRLYIAQTQKSLPHRAILTGMVITALCFVYAFHGGFRGVDVAVSLFILLLTLKLFESRKQRDLLFIVLLNYFLTGTGFFFNQSLLMLGHLLISVWGVTVLLLAMHSDHGMRQLPIKLRIATKMLLQALPIAAVLFLLFPRLPSPLWGLPNDHAVTGLSDKLSPGDISQLTQNPATAFRVDFANKADLKDYYYWRALVLNEFDGREWTQQTVPSHKNINQFGFVKQRQPIAYSVTLEPHNQPWLITMDIPIRDISNSHINSELIFNYHKRRNNTVTQRMRYDALSDPFASLKVPALQHWERTLYLQTPNNNAQTRRWAQQSRAEYATDQDFIRGLLRYIYSGDFSYTLTPPLIQHNNFVDAFWLGTRKGFCSHYASAIAYILRVVGIPARLVAGYQGGEINPIGEYLIVSQSNAHVWVEAWVNGQWQRIDPTAAIHPARVEQNLQRSNSNRQPTPEAEKSLQSTPSFSPTGFDWLRLQYDNVNHQWNTWIIGYNKATQMQVLSWLGLKNFSSHWLLYLLGFLIALTFALLFHLLYRTRQQQSPVSYHYQRLSHKMEKLGLQRLDSEGPSRYFERLIQHLPKHQTRLRRLMQLYISLEFKNTRRSHNVIRSFAKEVSRLKVSKSDYIEP